MLFRSQLAAQAEIKIKEVFNKLAAVTGEKDVEQITMETDQLMKECQHAITNFAELKYLTLKKVPELGPLFGQGEEMEKIAPATEASGPMEIEAGEKD